ncbi:MAG: cytosolic protein [Deltaproteobacteria bacterium RBG_13_49_15]|nr:MAG: cytosolic protein [Deltaproteobacteria bacterium RBG_13_49_15]
MSNALNALEGFDPEQRARFILDMFHRIVVHYALWFTEIRHQMGMKKALELLTVASKKSYEIQMNRLSKVLGFEMANGIPAPLLNMPLSEQERLLEAVAANWLANDGVWFQTVEFTSGMDDAKRCNDTCWAHFSPFEALSIKHLLGITDGSGLEGLKKALNYRLYAMINIYSILDENPGSVVFQMNECRVQTTRNRKGLDDYPCKSGGTVEYTTFAKTIDPRIRTTCIGCPPDKHPENWYCAWRFTISEESRNTGAVHSNP